VVLEHSKFVEGDHTTYFILRYNIQEAVINYYNEQRAAAGGAMKAAVEAVIASAAQVQK